MQSLDDIIRLSNNNTHQTVAKLLRDELVRAVPNSHIVKACYEWLRAEQVGAVNRH